MTLIVPGIPPSIANLAQERTLERLFHDALIPNFTFRRELVPDLWAANLGESLIMTRGGLMDPVLAPLVPGTEPAPSNYTTEQWTATASQWQNSIDIHMPTNYVTLSSLYAEGVDKLGINAAMSLNRIVRNRLVSAYCGGEASVATAAAIGARSVHVGSLSGFTEVVTAAGRLSPVSAANPLTVTFSNTEPANTVTGATPDDPLQPLGPGVLTLGAAMTVGTPLRTAVYAATRSVRVRVGAGATVDNIAGTNILTLDDVISAVARLRDQNVPPHGDGYYHCHLDPLAEAEIFRDAHHQRLYTSLPNSPTYDKLEIGRIANCIIYRSSELPKTATVSSTIALGGGAGNALVAPEIGAEVVNAGGVAIRRTMVTGGKVGIEKYLDESKFISEAGVTGKIGNFSIVNNGMQVMVDRVRLIIRAPLDRGQQQVALTWSWSGDFPIPSDLTTGDAARYKRCVVIEHA